MAAAKAAAASLIPKRADKMTEEVRSPLSDLNPTEYFAEGLDATSVVLVHDDAEETHVPEEIVTVEKKPVANEEAGFTFQTTSTLPSKAEPPNGECMSTAEIGALLMASAPVWDTETLVSSPCESDFVADENAFMPIPSAIDDTASGAIDIWESESAKDDNEVREDAGSENIFALQEL